MTSSTARSGGAAGSLSASEAAEILGIKPGSVQSLVRRGRLRPLPRRHKNQPFRFRRKDVEMLADERTGVPAKTMQQVLRDAGLNYSEAAADLGWLRRDGRPDTLRLKRALGLVRWHEEDSPRREVPYAEANQMFRAWLKDPVDYGA